MTDSLDEQYLETSSNRLRRMDELQQNMNSLDGLMRVLADDINDLFVRAGVRGSTGVDHKTSDITLRARVQAQGALAVRYGWRDRHTRKITSRTWLVDKKDRDKGKNELLIRLPEPFMAELVELDRTRMLLNHQFKVVSAEMVSLKHLHQSHQNLDAVLKAGRRKSR